MERFLVSFFPLQTPFTQLLVQKGVTIPSQKRYIAYYEDILKYGMPEPPTIKLVSIKIYTTEYAEPGKTGSFAFVVILNSLIVVLALCCEVKQVASTGIQVDKDSFFDILYSSKPKVSSFLFLNLS